MLQVGLQQNAGSPNRATIDFAILPSRGVEKRDLLDGEKDADTEPGDGNEGGLVGEGKGATRAICSSC